MTPPDGQVLGDAPPFIDVVAVPDGEFDDWWSDLQAAAQQQRPGTVLRRIDGARCTTTAGLFDCAAAALAFPDYFGRNWDAFEECVNDLGWLLAPAYLVVVEHGELLLTASGDEQLGVLDSVLNAPELTESGPGGEVVPLRFVLATSDPEQLAQRLRRAGVRHRVNG